MVWLLNSRKRKQPLETQLGLDRLGAMSWCEFEALVGESFRQRGYLVEETGKGGLEGDIDLILRKDGRTELVQCKQWQARQFGVATVRELWGLVAHRKADALKIVCAGAFTVEAGQFAEGKAIQLIDGEGLLELVRGVQVSAPTSGVEPTPVPDKNAMAPTCPRCHAAMFKRFNPQIGQLYWSCIMYPRCKGTQSI